MSTPPQQIPAFTLSCAKVRGNVKNTRYPDDRQIHALDDLLSAAQWDHTPAGFADGVRGNGRWRCTECVVLDVDNDPRAAYFEQVQNGVYIRMALIMTLLGLADPKAPKEGN